jgi:hypothetical protein
MSVKTRLTRAEQRASKAMSGRVLFTVVVAGVLYVDGKAMSRDELAAHIDATRPGVIIHLGPCDWPPVVEACQHRSV